MKDIMIKYRTNWITPNTLTMDGDDEHSKLVDALEENGPAIKRAADRLRSCRRGKDELS